MRKYNAYIKKIEVFSFLLLKNAPKRSKKPTTPIDKPCIWCYNDLEKIL